MRDDPPIPAAADPSSDLARRAPALPGARNLRDLGGYPTTDGRQVRWGMIYRSGSLAALTAEGVEALRALGLNGLCDLRTSHEREADPYGWREDLGLSYWSRDYETSFGELRALMAQDVPTGEEARQAMLSGYRRLPFEQAPAYGELFRRLARGEMPLLFNCSAGKDRAGTGAALILTALGVSREIVAADYALTDRLLDRSELVRRSDGGTSLLARLHPDVVNAILGCDPDYIRAALDVVAPTELRFAEYLNDTLGIDRAMLNAIRERLLEPASA